MRNIYQEIIDEGNNILETGMGDLRRNVRAQNTSLHDDEFDTSYLIYQKIANMSEPNRQRVAGYVDGLLQAANS